MTDKWIKKKLLMSSTLPMGTGGAASGQWMMGSGHSHGHHHHHHDHEHAADGSCCGHDHHHHDDDEDTTNPKGGCC